MKLRILLLAAFAVLPTGCGFVGHTVGTVANAAGGLLNTVTAPLHLADAPDAATEKAWSERTAALNREDAAKNDRRRTQAKRRY
ncbi:MAG TPA: hypothetical protein VHM91_16640 [Verrucomicrobiales bacterium]|jgi:hypothetical protein|nr:hypothetical protein [Verrucomicrobiales bacterium]